MVFGHVKIEIVGSTPNPWTNISPCFLRFAQTVAYTGRILWWADLCLWTPTACPNRSPKPFTRLESEYRVKKEGHKQNKGNTRAFPNLLRYYWLHLENGITEVKREISFVCVYLVLQSQLRGRLRLWVSRFFSAAFDNRSHDLICEIHQRQFRFKIKP
jgi:hypothetical protein